MLNIHHMVCIEEWRYTDALSIQLSTQKEYMWKEVERNAELV